MNWNPLSRTLTLSEAILEPLGYPHRLMIARHGERGLVLAHPDDPRATGTERRVNYPGRAAPRMVIGSGLAETLGLVPGRYFAWIADGALHARPISQGMPDWFYQVQQAAPGGSCALAVLEHNPRTHPAVPALKRYTFIDAASAHAFASRHGWQFAGEPPADAQG
jgi:hypothetical protein